MPGDDDARRVRRIVGEAPFVGRAREFRQLMSKLSAARQGAGQVVVLNGPAGIGKTRLAEEFAGRVRRRGVPVAIGRCWRDGEAPPLWPWQDVLKELGAPDRLLADGTSETGGERFARFAAVLDFLGRASRSAPAVVVVDDIHIAGPATLLLTRFLIRERRRLNLLLLLTRRDDVNVGSLEGDDVWTDVSRDGFTMTLGGLSEHAVGAYLAGCGVPEVGRQLVHGILAITRGNPLHLRSVVGQGRIDGDAGESGLEEAIGRIVGQLTETDGRLVGLAALLGMAVSPHEVARLAEVPPSVAAAAVTHAVALGVMQELPNERLGFVHERVRDRALSRLTPGERLDAYARAARLMTGSDADRALRRAYYAFAAASRSTDDAAFAVATAREAAAAQQAADGFERAATILAQATALHDAAALGGPAARLLVELAEAVLACGRLADARPLFHRAASVAEAERDRVALARAALGLGGVWVREHRLAVDSERVTALQARARDALPPEATVLRARLAVRLAAEAAYRGGPVPPVLEGVDAIRRTGDARALAEALSLYHHVLLTPENTWRRLEIANELMAAAARARDGLLSLVGLCWRTADLFLMGDHAAVAALAELRFRADAMNCRSVLFIVRAMEVMLAIRSGQLEEAESAAAVCFKLGMEVGDADALAYHGAHVAAIRGFQGREAELAETAASLATSPSVIERERIFSYAAALYAARAGRLEPARALLESLRGDGVSSIRQTSAWLLTMRIVADLAAVLDDSGIAQSTYEVMRPYADLPLMGSLGVVCFGSAHRVLGMAALTTAKLDLAVEHFAAAVTANERLGHRPAALQTRAELGLAYLRRGGPGDMDHGQTLLEDAIADAEALQMSGLASRWRAAASRYVDDLSAITAPEPSPDKLSPRLRQTLVGLVEGNSEKQVAALLGVSRTTVHQYVTALYRHFGVRSRGELLAHVLKRVGRVEWRRSLDVDASERRSRGPSPDA